MKKVFCFFLCLFTIFSAKNAWAASLGGLGIRPANPDPQSPLTESWFIYNLLPGETKNDAFIVSNTSDKVLSAKLYPVDGTTTSDGSFALLGETEEKKDLGSWVTLSQNQITVNPGEEKIIPFTITIPETASVGDHLGGIILENLEVSKGKGVNVVTRVGVRIYQTIPGELSRKLALENLSWKLVKGKPTFYFDFRNEGNVHLIPSGKLIIKDGVLGITLASFDVNLGMVLPGKPTKVPLTWQKSWPLGLFKAKAEIAYGDKPAEKIEKEISFGYVSSSIKGGVFILGGLILVLLVRPFVFKAKK
jgi:hypothetical protein